MISVILQIWPFAIPLMFAVAKWQRLKDKPLWKASLIAILLSIAVYLTFWNYKEITDERKDFAALTEKFKHDYMVNILQLQPIDYNANQAIEFPNQITIPEQNQDIVIPFQLGVGLEQVTANIHIEKRNIVDDIKRYSPEPYMANKFHIIPRENGETLIILYKGDIFLNIPFRRTDVRPDSKIKLTIDLLKGKNLDKTFDLFYDVNLEPWDFSADFSKHELTTGENLELALIAENEGIKGSFYIDSKLMDVNGKIIRYLPIEYTSDFELDFNDRKEFKLNLKPFQEAGKYVIDLAVVKRIGYLQIEHNKVWRDNHSSKKYYFLVKDEPASGQLSLTLDDELKSLLEATISDLESTRQGSVIRLIKILDSSEHEMILNFYLSRLEGLIDSNNQDGVYNATIIISKLNPELFQRYQKRIEGIYNRIYGFPDWHYTSEKYNYIKQYFNL